MDDLYLKLCQELSSILASAPAVDALMFRATGPQAAVIRAINRIVKESEMEFDDRLDTMSKNHEGRSRTGTCWVWGTRI